MRRLRLLLLLALAGLLLAACRVDATVGIVVEEDGSGTATVTVVLDREAAQRLGDPTTAVRLDDLRAAGWTVEDPATDADSGALSYRAQREFASPDQLASVLAEVGGGDGTTTGVFRDVELGLTNGFGSTSYEFSSGVELTGSLEQFSDADLTAALGGLPLARTPEELAVEIGTDPATTELDVRVVLPGVIGDSNGKVDGSAATWVLPLAGGTPTTATMTASSAVTERTPVLLVALGAMASVLALVTLVVGLVRRRA